MQTSRGSEGLVISRIENHEVVAVVQLLAYLLLRTIFNEEEGGPISL